MASPSAPGQPSSPDPGSVLCDKCKNSVLEPSQNTENVTLADRMGQVVKEWLLSPQLWPVGYVMGSPYSPFRVEKELPKRDWRDAFEDLLALESGGEMISHESRKHEKAVAANLSWERAKHCIETLNKLNSQAGPLFSRAQTALNAAKSTGQLDPSITRWLDDKLNESREMMQRRVAVAEAFKAKEATSREWSASRRKDRGQWMASLITSGALRGWGSALEDSEHGPLITLYKEQTAPEDYDSIALTERELHEHFEGGKPFEAGVPGPPWYEVSSGPPAVSVDDHQVVEESSSPQPPPEERIVVSRVPDRPYFSRQTTAAECITLPNGKMATRVVMKNYLTNGGVEEKVILHEPGKVLQEVEKARALIQDRMFGFDKLI